MKIKWYAHAAFLIQSGDLRIVTDPYTPESMGFSEITEPANVVIRSSADDGGHCNADMIRGNPTVITATEIIGTGAKVDGLTVGAVGTQESLIHKEVPLDNAMYWFTLEGMRIAHMGDLGNALTSEQIAPLIGADILFPPTGGAPTIELEDLYDAIQIIRPRLIFPMHYMLPTATFDMLPIEAFLWYFSPTSVKWIDGSEFEVTHDTLPAEQQVIILKPSTP